MEDREAWSGLVGVRGGLGREKGCGGVGGGKGIRIGTLLELSQLLQSGAVRISGCSPPNANEDDYTRSEYTRSVFMYTESGHSQ